MIKFNHFLFAKSMITYHIAKGNDEE